MLNYTNHGVYYRAESFQYLAIVVSHVTDGKQSVDIVFGQFSVIKAYSGWPNERMDQYRRNKGSYHSRATCRRTWYRREKTERMSPKSPSRIWNFWKAFIATNSPLPSSWIHPIWSLASRGRPFPKSILP